MNVSVIVATHGGEEWDTLARRRAIPSAVAECPAEIIPLHLTYGTLAQARNTGAAKAEGDWLCFLDADDELAPGYLTAMYLAASFFEALPDGIPRLLVPAVQYVQIVEERVPGIITKAEPPRVLNDGRPLHEINRAVIGTLIPSTLWWEVGGFREMPLYEDWELWLRCERAGAQLIDVEQAVYRVYQRQGSRNAPPRPQAQETYWRIRREHEAWLEAPAA